jgi:hypothetical protein
MVTRWELVVLTALLWSGAEPLELLLLQGMLTLPVWSWACCSPAGWEWWTSNDQRVRRQSCFDVTEQCAVDAVGCTAHAAKYYAAFDSFVLVWQPVEVAAPHYWQW